jgi:hypothetical protein
MTEEPLLFDAADIPEMAVPVAEWSIEAREASMLQLIERIRYDPVRLAAYEAKVPDGRDFLDHVIWQLGGRSQ